MDCIIAAFQIIFSSCDENVAACMECVIHCICYKVAIYNCDISVRFDPFLTDRFFSFCCSSVFCCSSGFCCGSSFCGISFCMEHTSLGKVHSICYHSNAAAAFTCDNIKGSVFNLQICTGAHSVTFRSNFKGSICYIKESQTGIVCIFCMNAIFAGNNGKCSVCDTYAVLARNPMICSCNMIGPACKNQIIF